MADDKTLVRDFVSANSESAFAALVERHVDLVYPTALRRTGDPYAADEVTQGVFIIFARKAHSLRSDIVLTGWLYNTTRLPAETCCE